MCTLASSVEGPRPTPLCSASATLALGQLARARSECPRPALRARRSVPTGHAPGGPGRRVPAGRGLLRASCQYLSTHRFVSHKFRSVCTWMTRLDGAGPWPRWRVSGPCPGRRSAATRTLRGPLQRRATGVHQASWLRVALSLSRRLESAAAAVDQELATSSRALSHESPGRLVQGSHHCEWANTRSSSGHYP
jgi:hypothetical protein